ncbi:MAG TPA: DUF393 domain-containing protein [Gemmataceae bacterium]|nr:DUF393 domain-containing protein [Gemmataceae bacterium]
MAVSLLDAPYEETMARLRERTTPPGKYVLLYDGWCKFCAAQAKNLVALARPGALQAVSFQDPGVLERFPSLTHDECMQAMHVVTPDGTVYGGFEAAVRAVLTRPILGRFANLYYIPGLRQTCERLYAWIAARRYRIRGKTEQANACTDGTCALHVPPR